MVVVRAKPGESMDKLISRFRKRILQSRVLLEYRERERHKSPATLRNEKNNRMRRIREIEKKYGEAE